MVDQDELIGEIIGVLELVQRQSDWRDAGDREWTRAVKTALCTRGNELGHFTCASSVDCSADNAEWLYDVVWLAYEPDKDIKDHLGSVPLVAESEWGTDDEIDHDFEKLLLALADLRVMIFGGKNDDNNKTAERLYRYVSKFNRGGPEDVYLLAGHEGDEIGFRFYRIQIEQELQVRDGINWRTLATS